MRTYDINEAADFLKIHPKTAHELACSGELTGAKIGRAWVFLEDDLIQYIREKGRQQVVERRTERDGLQMAPRRTHRSRTRPILPELIS